MQNNNEVKINSNVVIGVVVLIAALVGTTGYFYGKSTAPAVVAQPTATGDTTAQQQVAPTVTMDQVRGLFDGKNITFGDKNSKLVFIEFSDPSCPFCHVASGKNGALNKQMGDRFILKEEGGSYVAPVTEIKKLVDAGKAAFVWMYANGHGAGEVATIAQYCAFEKGKFWQVHDLLMSEKGYEIINTTVKNDRTKASEMANFLKSVMDPTELKSCIESKKYDDKLVADMTVAKQFGFQGTPYFLVNTTPFSGAYSFTDMQSSIDGVK